MDVISGKELRHAAFAGTVVAGRQGDTRRTLDAAIVRQQCLEPAGQVDPHGIRVRGAIVSGRLDLAAVSALFPLVFDDCIFEQAPNLDGVTLSRPEYDVLIDAFGLRINGAVQLDGLRADGGSLDFTSATVSSIRLDGAVLSNGDGPTLSLEQITVNGSVRLVDLVSHGYLRLDEATISGGLNLLGSTLDCPAKSATNRGGHALQARSVTAAGGMFLLWSTCSPSVELTDSATSVLVDDPTNWPATFSVSGLTYDRFDGARDSPIDPWDVRHRARWLEAAEFNAGAYEQAARVFRQHGYAREAEFLLICQRDVARVVAGPRTRPTRVRTGTVWAYARYFTDWLFGRAVGYGFRPGRSLIALIALLVIVVAALQFAPIAGSLRAVDVVGNVYATDGRITSPIAGTSLPAAEADGCSAGRIRCFDSALYGIDTVVPLVSLDQRATWYATAGTGWGIFTEFLLNTATLLGWLLSTIVVLSFARLARPLGLG